MKKIIALLLTAILLLNLTACSGETAAYSISEATAPTAIVSVAQSTDASTTSSSTTNTTQTVTSTAVPVSVEYESDDLDVSDSDSATTAIILAGDSISVDGNGATVDGSVVTITAAGTYDISGVLNDGQIVVDTADEATVRLTLNGVQITSSTSAPIYVANAEKVVITLAAGTQNYVTDGEAYVFEDPASDEPNAAIFSHDDLTINGDGALIVNANYNNGIFSKDDLKITGGTITVHSNGTLTVDGGDLVLATGDDGIHADATLVINNGNINITQSYEGLESAVIIINEGTVHIVSSDDGINVSDGSGEMMGGGGMETASAVNYLEINGGYIYVDAGGDGLDSNGMGTLNDGLVIVNGPTTIGNGALDVGGNLVVNGGFLVAVGSAGMAQSPSTASTQYSALINLQGTLQAGSIAHIESEDGENILTFAPTKTYQTVVISSPEMENGATHVVDVGGQATGMMTDGLYADGTYTAGTQVSSFTIASIVTGQSGGMGGPGGGHGRP
ncbi:MAG: carbohydrate-binding domain-containing protein [Anaerolineae bacterium]